MVIGMKPRLSLLCALGLTLVLTGCAIDVSSSSTASSIEESSKTTSQTSSVASSSDEEPDTRETTEETTEEDTTEVTTAYETSESEQTTELTSVLSTEQTSVSIPDTDAHWDLDFSTYGKTFMVTLGKQIISTGGTTSYKNCLSVGAKAMAYPNANSNTFIPFYHDHTDANKTTTNGCNREHTWPDSRGGGSIESDPIMVRPTLTKDNSDRGNNFYGIGSKQWDPASCGYEGARGESARIILYCATAYNNLGLSLSNNPSDGTGKKTMGTLKTLLKWNREYAPTEWEKTVNDRYDEMGYRRNPFVDHPEYAEWIWDDNGLRTTPYGGDVPVTSGSSSSSSAATSIDPGKTYDVASIDDLDGKKIAVTFDGHQLGDAPKQDKYPWYIASDEVTLSGGKLVDSDSLVWYEFTEKSSDTYTLKLSNNKYLYGYLSDKHYSICIAGSESEVTQLNGSAPSFVSNEWKAKTVSGGVQLAAGDVILRYDADHQTWSGSSTAAAGTALTLFAQN